ncbi:MAG: hypothetical protein R2875_12755 [Desulfobacterales bacterium]
MTGKNSGRGLPDNNILLHCLCLNHVRRSTRRPIYNGAAMQIPGTAIFNIDA